MKISVLILLFNVILSLYMPANAKVGTDSDLAHIVEYADVICVGLTGKVEAQQTTATDVATAQESKKFLSVVDFHIENTLKGQPPNSEIQILFPNNSNLFGTNVYRSTKMVTGERVLVFLSAGSTPTQFLLAMPYSTYSPKIPLGPKLLNKSTLPSTPFRQVISVLAESLYSNDRAVQVNSLTRLREISYIFFLPSKSFRDYTYAEQTKKALNEPQLPSLEVFAAQGILIPVKALMLASDTDVAANSLICAAAFQDSSIIPNLIKLAETSPVYRLDALNALDNYRVPGAVKPLVLALQNKNTEVRVSAAHSLRDIANPLALPFLAEHLGDSNREVRFWVTGAFSTTTDSLDWLPTTEAFKQNEIRFISHWQQWIVQNQNKLMKLRSQFQSVAPVDTVP